MAFSRGICKMRQNHKVVATMTSWTKRIGNCASIVKSLLGNTLKPDAVYLNLSTEEFPEKEANLPQDLVQLSKDNPIFNINWVDGPNMKPWKKVFPILQYLDDDDLIVLVDDDMSVQKNLMESRVNEFQENCCLAAITGGGSCPRTHLNIPLLNWTYNTICPSSILQKRMLNGWERFMTKEILESNHDDFLYSMLCLTNGYRIVPSRYISVKRPKELGGFGMHQMGMCKSDSEMVEIFAKAYENATGETLKHRLTRIFKLRRIFLVIWDSYDVAGDNGECLYRRVREFYPEIRMVFLLSSHSKDWRRLNEDGFNLYPFQGKSLKKILTNATFICFSKNLPRCGLQMFMKKFMGKTIFLQHGVTYQKSLYIKNNISKCAKYICCALKNEDATILDSCPSIKTLNCGFPRHDTLFIKNLERRKNTDPTKKTIFICFHWRTSGIESKGYLEGVNGFLNSDGLKNLAEQGHRILFLPHAMFMEHLEKFKIPTYVQTPKEPFQDVLVKSDILITDTSSNIFEMAYMGKPSISWMPEGEWNIGNDGIKDYINVHICNTKEDVFKSLEGILESKNCGVDETLAELLFDHVDANNTERLVEWMLKSI